MQRKIDYYLLVILLVTFIVSVPFLLSPAESWDMIGHKKTIETLKENNLNPYFFNYDFFLGYEQFQSYPPLFYFLVGILSYILGLNISFKLIILIFWMLTPISIYLLSKEYMKQKYALLATTASMLTITATTQHLGATFFTTFVIGNVTNAMALPLVLLSIYYLKQKKYFYSTLLVLTVTLTHIIYAVLLGILILCYSYQNKKNLYPLLGFIAAAFWLMPFIFTIDAGIVTHDDYFVNIIEIIALALFYGLYYVYYKKNDETKPIFLFSIIILSLIVTNRYFHPHLWIEIPLHYHRIKLLTYILIIIASFTLLQRINPLTKYVKKYFLYPKVAILTAILIFGFLNFSYIEYQQKNIDVQGERILTIEELNFKDTNPHNFRYELAKQNKIAKGLFVEASSHSRKLLSLEQSLTNKTTYRWGVPYIPEYLFLENKKAIEIIEALGFSKIISDHLIIINNTFSMNQDLYIYDLKGELAYVPKDLAFISPEEFPFLRNNFLQNPKNAYVKVQNPMPEDMKFDAQISYELNKNLKVKVDSNELTPILINLAYTNKWRAKTMTGENLPVYKAYPGRTLVFSNQDFKLVYSPLGFLEIISIIISILTLILIYKTRKFN
ncbi:MAG: hypothetical protein ACMXX7_01115 [Candidatus Woesearchaeota archaeon]